MALPEPMQGSVVALPSSQPATGPLLGLVIGVAALFCASLALGSVRIPIYDVITILIGGETHTHAWQQIVTQIRLPRAMTAGLGGAALAVSGLQMQTLFRNPLAGPFVLRT